MPTSHIVSLTKLYTHTVILQRLFLSYAYNSKWCLTSFVSPSSCNSTASSMLLVLHNHMYYSINKWGLSFCNTYHLVFLSQNHWCLLFREKHPVQQLHSKRGRAYIWGWDYHDTCLASKSPFVLIGLSGLPAWHEMTIGEFSKAMVIPHCNNITLYMQRLISLHFPSC